MNNSVIFLCFANVYLSHMFWPGIKPATRCTSWTHLSTGAFHRLAIEMKLVFTNTTLIFFQSPFCMKKKIVVCWLFNDNLRAREWEPDKKKRFRKSGPSILANNILIKKWNVSFDLSPNQNILPTNITEPDVAYFLLKPIWTRPRGYLTLINILYMKNAGTQWTMVSYLKK